MYLIETQRLGLRPFELGDAGALYALNADPKVIRYTGDPPFESESKALAFLQGYAHYQQYGYGRWAVILKETSAFIGWCGLKYSPALNETDLGFRFFRAQWSQGYATEAANACLFYGHQALGLPHIVGRAMCDNQASIRVLEKLGMRFQKTIDFEGAAGVQYLSTLAAPSFRT